MLVNRFMHTLAPKAQPVSAFVSGKLANVILVYKVPCGRRMLRPIKPCRRVVSCTSQNGVRAGVEVDVVCHIVHLHTKSGQLGSSRALHQQGGTYSALGAFSSHC